MKIIKILTKQICSELCDADSYIDKAFCVKADYNKLAEVYSSLATAELGHAEELHKQAVSLITDYRGKAENVVPEYMKEIWEEEHLEIINRMAEIKNKIDLFKR